MRKILMATAAAVAGLAGMAAHAADPVADFYKGKEMYMQVGSAAGGGYDVYARVVARHWPKHIPGNPRMVVQNVPGGGSLRLANQFGNITPRDGLYVGVMSNGVPTTPLLNPETTQYDSRKFGFIGSPTAEKQVAVFWHQSPAKNMESLFKTEIIVGASSPGSPTVDYPLLTNALLGTKFKVISGYEGASSVKLAMPRGEVHGNAALALGSLPTAYADMVKNKELLTVAQFGFTKHPDIPEVPLMPTGDTEEVRQIFELTYSRERFGRLFVTPPDVPAERLKALRESFYATIRDPAFLADAKKTGTDIDLVQGEELEALAKRLYTTPKPVVDRMQAILSTKVEAKKE